MSTAIVYGSNGGATEEIATKIHKKLGFETTLLDISEAGIECFSEYDKFIIGTSTWGEGDYQDDWDNVIDEFENVGFGGKTVAFFGLGDQEGYEENFLDAMGNLHDIVKENGATIVGDNWSTEGYEYDDSTAENADGSAFCGLGIDEDNQYDLTDERIDSWIKIIKPHFE